MPELVTGETAGLKASQRRALEKLGTRRVPPDLLVTRELLHHLLDVADEAHRRIGVLVDRRGHVVRVVVGTAHRIYLPDLGRARASQKRLRGVRWIQTQHGHASLHRDDLTDLSKLHLDLVLNVTRDDHQALHLAAAHLLPASAPDEPHFRVISGDGPEAIVQGDFLDYVTQLEAELEAKVVERGAVKRVQKNGAMLVVTGQRRQDLDSSAIEMRELCATAGLTIVDESHQLRKEPDPRYLVGKGKLEDIVLTALQHDADTLVFDRELTPAQVRSIAHATELKVIDRTQLILDIFAQHAHSEDGQVQVELAQLKYNLPRLTEKDDALSRLTGGIGGRGPGETKLEINRRRARDRLTALERRIADLSARRELRRKQRRRHDVPIVSIVGYTNAGKSTLMNALTGSEVLVEDKLFATLDPATRRLRLPSGRHVVLTDTVGFIRDLPADLVNAFRATLEELEDADLLLHVADSGDEEREEKVAAVHRILLELGLASAPRILVWNKVDTVERTPRTHGRDREAMVSALHRRGLGELLGLVDDALGRARDVDHHADPS